MIQARVDLFGKFSAISLFSIMMIYFVINTTTNSDHSFISCNSMMEMITMALVSLAVHVVITPDGLMQAVFITIAKQLNSKDCFIKNISMMESLAAT